MDNILPGSPACPPSPLSSPQSVCANTGKVVSGPSYTVRKSQHPPKGPPVSISTYVKVTVTASPGTSGVMVVTVSSFGW